MMFTTSNRNIILAFVAFGCFNSEYVVGLQQQEPSRRDFLTQTASSIVAGSTAPLCIPPLAANAEDSVPFTAGASSTSAIQLPKMGLGCWAWGDSLFWGYNPKNDADLEEVFNYAIRKSAPVLFDTAELYGFGRSESLLGDFSKTTKEGDAIIATKFAPFPFRTKPENVVKACEASVKRLGGKPIDLYQIHFPNAYANAEYWDGMAMAYEKGLIKAIGVSNYGVDATRACHAALAKRGIPLATNQIQYSLLYRYPEENGLLQACEDLGVKVLSYSPMVSFMYFNHVVQHISVPKTFLIAFNHTCFLPVQALGLLTGKYNTDSVKEIQGPRKKLFQKTVGTPEFDNLMASMKQVAASHGNNLPQVAINWCRAKGTIPIPGARNLRQVQSNYGALDWDMTPEEVIFLDKAASKLSYIDPSANPFPKVDKDTGLIMYDS